MYASECVCVCVCIYTFSRTHTLASDNKNKKLRELGWRGCFLGVRVKSQYFSLACVPLYIYLSLSRLLGYVCVCVCVREKVQFSITTVEFRILLTTIDIPWLLLFFFFILQTAEQRVFNFTLRLAICRLIIINIITMNQFGIFF